MTKKIDLCEKDKEQLIEENYSSFTSTMIEIVKKRTAKINPNDILQNYATKYNYYRPSSNSALIYNELENIFYHAVTKDYECIELSPIVPVATNSKLTRLSQDMSLSTIRNIDVTSDSSTQLSLEAAYRKKELIKISKTYDSTINLATSMRLLRMQNYGNGRESHWTQHFRAFALLSAFRNINDNMIESINNQIVNWLNVIDEFNKNKLELSNIRVNIAYLPLVKEILKYYEIDFEQLYENSMNPNFDNFKNNGIDLNDNIQNLEEINIKSINKKILKYIETNYIYIEKMILSKLKKKFPNVIFNFQLNRKSGLNYYENICYEILVTCNDGKELCLVDGGVTNWTGKLLGDKKEKCISSGMGTEYLAKVYRRK